MADCIERHAMSIRSMLVRQHGDDYDPDYATSRVAADWIKYGQSGILIFGGLIGLIIARFLSPRIDRQSVAIICGLAILLGGAGFASIPWIQAAAGIAFLIIFFGAILAGVVSGVLQRRRGRSAP